MVNDIGSSGRYNSIYGIIPPRIYKGLFTGNEHRINTQWYMAYLSKGRFEILACTINPNTYT